MTQVEITTDKDAPFAPSNPLDTKRVDVVILEDKYLRINIRRLVPDKKRIKIIQDGKGDLIVEYDNKRVVDERVS